MYNFILVLFINFIIIVDLTDTLSYKDSLTPTHSNLRHEKGGRW